MDGVFVTLVDGQGREVARAITDARGRFHLTAPAAGIYRLRSKRIGFRPQDSPPLHLTPGPATIHRLAVDPIPISLGEIVVEGERRCDLRDERRGTAVATLWEEVREALSAVSWTGRRTGYWYASALFERDVAPAGRRVQRDSTWTRAGYSQTAFHSVPAHRLADEGYLLDEEGGRVYYAPDADVLLSDPFLATHCFEVRVGRGDAAGLVGLAFTPARGRRLVDVSGVLWLDRTTTELRSLEFEYVNLPPELRVGPAEGRVEFLRVPSGAWIVRDWVIRMPVVSVTRSFHGASQPRLLAVRETGGRVLEIKAADGRPIYTGDHAVVTGTVIDSTAGSPLTGAVVTILGTTHRATTDNAGRFRIAAPLDGDYRVSFSHPRLDSLGAAAGEAWITVGPGVAVATQLAIPPETVIVDQLCRDTTVGPSERVVIGVVREAQSGRTVAGAEVEAMWQEPFVSGPIIGAWNRRALTQTDGTGAYIVCPVPRIRTLTLVARVRSVAGPAVQLEEQASSDPVRRIWRRDLEVPRSP